MKWIHTGDLHIGKQLHGFSLLEEQREFLSQIAALAEKEQVDAVVLAGDVYDRSVPPSEAVQVLDDFLTELFEAQIPVLMISGNHDSAERLRFAGKILEREGLYVAGGYEGRLKKVTFRDAYGEVAFFLMPFVRPADVKAFAGEVPEDSDAAVNWILAQEQEELNKQERKVLVSHCFAAAGAKEPLLSDSESPSVGGLDKVDVSQFADFDYVALGHIHRPQKMGEGEVYYAGSPYKYSFSEAGQEKSVCLVELKEKGDLTVERIPLKPKRDLRCIKGALAELLKEEVAALGNRQDYLQVTLTDTDELYEPMEKLRAVYPNVMQLLLQKYERNENGITVKGSKMREKSVTELFTEFFETVTERTLDEERLAVIEEIASELGGGNT